MLRRAALASILAALALIPSWAGEDAAGLLKDFHARFDREPKEAKRREAVLALRVHADGKVAAELAAVLGKRVLSADDAVVEALCEVLGACDSPAGVVPLLDLALKPRTPPKYLLFVREALKPCRAPAALKAVADRGLVAEDPLALEAMADVLGEAAFAPAAERLQKLLRHPETRVRAAAAEALGRCGEGHPGAAPALRDLLSCAEPVVADSALAGLAWLGDAASWPAIGKALETGAWPLRCRLARALGGWKDDARVVPALISALGRERGRAVPVLAASLERLTGQRHGTDPKAWRDWWADRDKAVRFEEVPTGHAPREYFDVRYFSDRVVFLQDVSGSMNFGEVTKDPSAARSKIERSKEALEKAVAQLQPHTAFNVIAFSTNNRPWQPSLVPATPDNVRKAGDYVKGLQAIGGTNIRDALVGATGALMQKPSKGGPRAAYEPEGPDTVFLLTDGKPSRVLGPANWYFENPYEILAEFTFANRFQEAQCFTLGMTGDEKSKDDIDPVFLELLARWNGGTYTFLK